MRDGRCLGGVVGVAALMVSVVALGVPEPVSGYMGGSMVSVWEKMRPLVEAERAKQAGNVMPDPNRWQEHFENLYHLVREFPAAQARARTELWGLSSP